MRNRNYFTRMKTYFQTSFILLIACFCSGSYTQMDSYISMGDNPLTYQIHSGEVSYEEKMADHIEANKENVKEVTQDPKEYAKKRSIFEWFEDTAWDGFCNLWKFFRDLVKKIGNQVIDSFVELLSVTIFSVGISKKKMKKKVKKIIQKIKHFIRR